MRPIVNIQIKQAKPPQKTKPTNLIQTIERMNVILDVLGQCPQGISLGELSAHVNLPKGTTHRILSSLNYFGFVRQDAMSKNYSLGFRLVELGNRLLKQIDIREEARPYLLSLSQRTQETVHLMILDQNEVVYIDKVDAESDEVTLRMTSRIGLRIPPHACSSGKVLLSQFSEEALDALLAEKELNKITEYTITDPQQLKSAIARVRIKGYACDEQERERGIRCVAAPIRNDAGDIVASLSVSGTTLHVSKERLQNELRREVVATALEISKKLGFQGGE